VALKLADEIQSEGGRALPLKANSASAKELRAAVLEATQMLGPLDIVVSNAGILIRGTIDSYNLKDLDRMIAINIRAAFIGVQAAGKAMDDGGRIILIGSNTAIHTAFTGANVYSMTKAATDELMRCMDIGRQSMYDTFGEKRALFLRALELYVTESVQPIGVELDRNGSALSAVRNALVSFAERKDLSSSEGCIGLNASGEFGQRDDDVTRITRNAARIQRQNLVKVFARAKIQGEVDADADLEGMADFFESTLAGIRIAAKSGKSRQALRKVAAFAGRAFSGSDR
jgi:hypothetical protein